MGILSAAMLFSLPVNATETVSLGSLDLSKVQQSYGQAQADKSADGNQLTIGDKKYDKGLGTYASSTLFIDLKGTAEHFTASVGVDSEVKSRTASVEFRVLGDGRELWKSKVMRAGQGPAKADVNLKGVKILLLLVSDAGNPSRSNHADWADAKIEFTGERPETIAPPSEQAMILTPKPPATPRINGAKVCGVRPNAPFMFAIPATGKRPISFAAVNLPEGLNVDSKNGWITGSIKKRGEYIVFLTAKNNLGQDQRDLKIVCGDNIALTPPMGWNSWNCFAAAVDDAKVRSAADAMVQSGLINYGWTYINIDDCWEIKPDSDDPMLQGPPRDENGMINSNKKFPDMKALCDYIHAKGLKAGIYSSPGPLTCAGFTGSYNYEEKDAKRFAQWGFDYLKYDWCSYSQIAKDRSPPELKKPFQIMRAALDKTNRDIVYNLGIQLGASNFWQWGAEVGGNSWGVADNITDTWFGMSRIGFIQAGREEFAGPGHWNIPDTLVVGVVGWGNLHPTNLTPNEQYTHISLWCLLSSPLMLGCDLSKLDDFTLNLLTNDEVIDVYQDPLGKQSRSAAHNNNLEVWSKELENGGLAVGLFNRGEVESKVTANWSDLGLSGKQIVRDLWRQKAIGEFENQYSANVPRHGVLLLRLRPSGK
ncbi:MAG: NPCBM/NEW2 domain-containing protein, partial [Thermoguttaceae bacterium]